MVQVLKKDKFKDKSFYSKADTLREIGMIAEHHCPKYRYLLKTVHKRRGRISADRMR